LVSVIIPAFRAERYLASTIQSVLDQTHKNLEVIIVNDGSDDQTQAISEDFASKDVRVVAIYQENAGVSSARNKGMALAKGAFIALLDADDLMEPTSVAERLKKLNDGNFGLVHCDMIIVDEVGNPTGKINFGLEGKVLDDLLAWRKTVIPTPSSVLFKKNVVHQVGGFNLDLSNNADQEFFYRVASQFEIGRVAKPLGIYRTHKNQMHKNIELMYRDTLLAYKLATENGLFKSHIFRRKCYSRMYFILANCYLKDARKPLKATRLYFRSFFIHPPAFFNNVFSRS
jgi:glycosyltransferase involved in cell wall biosynthesis